MSQNGDKKKDSDVKINGPSMGRRHGPPGLGAEKANLDHERKTLWKWIFSFLASSKKKVIFFMLLLIFGTIISTASPLISKNLIDIGIGEQNMEYLQTWTIIYFGLLILMELINYVAHYGMEKLSQKVVLDIRNTIFSRLQRMSLSYFDKRSSGDIISIATNDVDQLNSLVGGQLVQIIQSIIAIALTLVYMFILHPLLALIGLLVIPIIMIMLKIFQKRVTGAFKETRKTISGVTSTIQENIAGAKVVQAYGQEEKAKKEFDDVNKADYDASYKVRKIFSGFFPLVNYVTSIMTIVILLIGALMGLNGITVLGIGVTVGVLTSFMTYLAQFFRPFMTIMQIQQVIEGAMAATDRIYGLLEEELEIPDSQNPKEIEKSSGHIKFENVDFGYILEKDEDMEEIPVKNNMKPEIGMQQGIQFFEKAKNVIQSLPEPYSSFMQENIRDMPQPLRRELMMSIMNAKPENAPHLIDSILEKHGYAVKGTTHQKSHPNLNTKFRSDSNTNRNIEPRGSMDHPIPPRPPMFQKRIDDPEQLIKMAKQLEKSISSTSDMNKNQHVGGGGKTDGPMGGLNPMMAKNMLEKFSRMNIDQEIFEQFPSAVQNAIQERRKLIKHKESKGYILKGVNFEIDSGKTVAIVGETGAGKTTIIKLISRFYDVNKGSIKIDKVDIRDITKETLRSQIGMVPQDAFIFTGTIKENILYAVEEQDETSENKMIEISKLLGLHNFIDTLPDKYDTVLKEMGSNVSIGQRQLIAFARALMTDPKILILDEATSSVDPYTETLIQDALDTARKGRTTIIIAHRLSTIKNADEIIVIGKEDRGISERGSHEELIALDGKYKRLLDMQYKDIEAKA